MFKNFMKGEKEAWVNRMADTNHPAGKKKITAHKTLASPSAH